jgi:hypothetical protein
MDFESRLPAHDLDDGDSRKTPLEQAVRSGNWTSLKKQRSIPKKDNVFFLDNAGWSPEPEVIESLLTSPICHLSAVGSIIENDLKSRTSK